MTSDEMDRLHKLLNDMIETNATLSDCIDKINDRIVAIERWVEQRGINE